ncbi:MAG: hypothetical protein Q8L52_02670 [bacterium]|nr:hypothetical protein [bacterium]
MSASKKDCELPASVTQVLQDTVNTAFVRMSAEVDKAFSEIREALAERREIGREISQLDSRLTGVAEEIGRQTLEVTGRPKFYYAVTGPDGKRRKTGHYG